MKYKLLLLLLLASSLAFPQKLTEELESRLLGSKRKITIVTPSGYNEKDKKKYPLLVLLDGQYLTDPFAGTLSYTSYWDDLPQVIIVGIEQQEGEKRDEDCDTYESTGLPQGTGDLFYRFIGEELVPYMEKEYNIAPLKIIAGHGLTAGFINFFLYKEKPLFNAYVSFSPQLPNFMETRLPKALSEIKKPVYYYMATADDDVKPIREKIITLNDSVKAVDNKALNYKFDDFKDASHYSLVTYGIPSALYHIFAQYKPITLAEFEQKLVTMPEGHVEYLENKYDAIKENLGIDIPVRLNDFRAIEAAIIKNGNFDELKDLSSIAKKSYPKTIIGEYYEGLYYEKKGKLNKAKKVYLNAYTYNDIGDYTKDFILQKAESLNID